MAKMSAMNSEVTAFAALMAQAESHRTILRTRFGLNDHQIGVMVQARQQKLSPLQGFAAAALAAKQRLARK